MASENLITVRDWTRTDVKVCYTLQYLYNILNFILLGFLQKSHIPLLVPYGHSRIGASSTKRGSHGREVLGSLSQELWEIQNLVLDDSKK